MMRYRGDPSWLTAKYDGECSAEGCHQPIKKGDRAFYYPNSRKILAVPCGHAEQASNDFEAHRQDEEGC